MFLADTADGPMQPSDGPMHSQCSLADTEDCPMQPSDGPVHTQCSVIAF